MSSLATRVTERLQKVGITPAQLARAAKVKPPSVSAWMSGDSKTIKGENLLRAAQALQCSPQWLATGIGPKSTDEAGPPAHVDREVRYLTDKLVDEAIGILKALDYQSRAEAVQWLRGYAAGRKTDPGADGHRVPVAKPRR